MELNIGSNIKRLRKAKNLTQENLADLLNISCAAVSKWENADSYPDITMLFPLASIFEVTVDELMGYDTAHTNMEIERILSEYQEHHMLGHFAECEEMICRARKQYPNDYRIMNKYMWHFAGGSADNDLELLREHHDEFIKICDCILNGCVKEQLRLEAMTMKAKLLHANGDTAAAVSLLEELPGWYQSSNQKIEQLFPKDTPEYRYRVQRNIFALSDGLANKIAKSIWYDEKLSYDERLAKTEQLGDLFTELHAQIGMGFLAVISHMLYAVLANNLTHFEGQTEDIIRIRRKQLESMKLMMADAENDTVLKEMLVRTYKTDDILQWQVDWMLSTTHTTHARLRENDMYMNFLQAYKTK